MKINRKLIAAFAMLSVVFGACTSPAPDVDCGVKSDLTAPGNVVWEESESSKTSLALTWDASAAIAAGATSFSAQVVKPNMETMEEGQLHDFITPDQYDSNTTVVLATTSNYVGSAELYSTTSRMVSSTCFAFALTIQAQTTLSGYGLLTRLVRSLTLSQVRVL